MKKLIIDIFASLTLLVGATLLVVSCTTECDEYGVPLEYSTRDQYLEVDFTEFIIEDVDMTTINIPIVASSAWVATSSESWATVGSSYYMGETDLILNVSLNREEKRSTKVTVTMTTAVGTFVEEFDVIQDVSYAAELTTPTSLSVSDEGGVTPLALSYNYGVKATVTEGAEWVYFKDGENEVSEIILDGESSAFAVKETLLDLYFDECGVEDREAVVVFTSTESEEITSTLYISQLAVIDPVIKFVDDFSESNANNSGNEFEFNPDMNWRMQNNLTSAVFKHYYWTGNTTYIYPWTNMLVYNAEATAEAYLILPPFDVARASEKSFSFWLGTSAGTYDNTAGTGAKLEVVYSTDFKGDAFAGEGTWSVLQDYTWQGSVTNLLPKTCHEVSLEAFAAESNLTIAFRYTGGSPALGYRVDNVRLGVAPQANQDQDTGDQYEN